MQFANEIKQDAEVNFIQRRMRIPSIFVCQSIVHICDSFKHLVKSKFSRVFRGTLSVLGSLLSVENSSIAAPLSPFFPGVCLGWFAGCVVPSVYATTD